MSAIKAVEGLAKPEMSDRRSRLLSATTQEDFTATLRWIAAEGKEEDLDLLREVNPRSSAETDCFLELEAARDEITTRAFDPGRQLQNFFGVIEAEFAWMVGSKEGSAVAGSRVKGLRLIKESWEAMFDPADAPAWFRSPVPRFDGRS